MATLSLPNLSLGIPVWYLDPLAATSPGQPKPYIYLTLVQPVPMTSPTITVPQPPQQEPPLVAIASSKKGKARKRASKDKAAPIDPAPSPHPKPCALFDFIGHCTHNYLELPHIKPMVNVAFPKSTVPEAPVSSLTTTKNPKTIHTNQPYALCDLHGHYSHHCPHLTHYRASLEVVREYEIEQNQFASPILAQYAFNQLEDLPTPIDIPPPYV